MTDAELVRRVAEDVMGWYWSSEWRAWFVKGEPYGCWPNELLPKDDPDDAEEQKPFDPIHDANHRDLVVEELYNKGFLCILTTVKPTEISFFGARRECLFIKDEIRYAGYDDGWGRAVLVAALKALGGDDE